MVEKQIRKRPEVEPVNGGWFKFVNEGDSLSGWFIATTQAVMSNAAGDAPTVVPCYRVVDEYGNITDFLGTAQLNSLMARIPHEAFIVVTYKGLVESRNHRMVKQFGVELEKGITLLKGLDNGAQVD